ncbi:hypothetical protein EJ110_NYTH39979 [Nymphaea thermarum]|nr:hypothetical protein EJ110_NYTH39979 [Nymphaea thermarum]
MSMDISLWRIHKVTIGGRNRLKVRRIGSRSKPELHSWKAARRMREFSSLNFFSIFFFSFFDSSSTMTTTKKKWADGVVAAMAGPAVATEAASGLRTHLSPHSSEVNVLVVAALRDFSNLRASRTRGVAAGRIAAVQTLELGYTGHIPLTLGDQIQNSRHFEEFCGCATGHQYAQMGVGAQTPPRQTPPVDQQTILLTTLQKLTSLVQSMVSNLKSNASPSGDTTVPLHEKALVVSFQQFMAMQLPVFTGGGSPDKANEWIEEVQSTREIRYTGQLSISWKQFRDSFFSTYFPVHVRDKKMQEFLDLQQNQLSLEEYITKYRHLEVYCLHLYTTDGARASKFVRGLRDGLRSKVLTNRPHDLDEAVTMARCIEDDWARIHKDRHKKAGQHSHGGQTQVKHQYFAGRARLYERHDDRTFRQNQPTRSEATQGSVATPTSQRCPTCSCVHLGKPCYQEIGACLHCGGMGHFIKYCPLKKERELKKPDVGPSSAR